jgi:septal ring factor EnvC (AmiA/AmiB activator)
MSEIELKANLAKLQAENTEIRAKLNALADRYAKLLEEHKRQIKALALSQVERTAIAKKLDDLANRKAALLAKERYSARAEA